MWRNADHTRVRDHNASRNFACDTASSSAANMCFGNLPLCSAHSNVSSASISFPRHWVLGPRRQGRWFCCFGASRLRGSARGTYLTTVMTSTWFCKMLWELILCKPQALIPRLFSSYVSWQGKCLAQQRMNNPQSFVLADTRIKTLSLLAVVRISISFFAVMPYERSLA